MPELISITGGTKDTTSNLEGFPAERLLLLGVGRSYEAEGVPYGNYQRFREEARRNRSVG
jgi:hypothetical protein